MLGKEKKSEEKVQIRHPQSDQDGYSWENLSGTPGPSLAFVNNVIRRSHIFVDLKSMSTMMHPHSNSWDLRPTYQKKCDSLSF